MRHHPCEQLRVCGGQRQRADGTAAGAYDDGWASVDVAEQPGEVVGASVGVDGRVAVGDGAAGDAARV